MPKTRKRVKDRSRI